MVEDTTRLDVRTVEVGRPSTVVATVCVSATVELATRAEVTVVAFVGLVVSDEDEES